MPPRAGRDTYIYKYSVEEVMCLRECHPLFDGRPNMWALIWERGQGTWNPKAKRTVEDLRSKWNNMQKTHKKAVEEEERRREGVVVEMQGDAQEERPHRKHKRAAEAGAKRVRVSVTREEFKRQLQEAREAQEEINRIKAKQQKKSKVIVID